MKNAQRPTAAPSGVVAFLFTDIEGSTPRWEADDVMRQAIDAHRGWLFKHTGDGVPRCRSRRGV